MSYLDQHYYNVGTMVLAVNLQVMMLMWNYKKKEIFSENTIHVTDAVRKLRI